MNNEGKLEGLRFHKEGEACSPYCDRLEVAIIEVIEVCDVSEGTIKILAFALMEAPADFDRASRHNPVQQVKNFFKGQSDGVKESFRRECMKLPRGREDRVSFLLGS